MKKCKVAKWDKYHGKTPEFKDGDLSKLKHGASKYISEQNIDVKTGKVDWNVESVIRNRPEIKGRERDKELISKAKVKTYRFGFSDAVKKKAKELKSLIRAGKYTQSEYDAWLKKEQAKVERRNKKKSDDERRKIQILDHASQIMPLPDKRIFEQNPKFSDAEWGHVNAIRSLTKTSRRHVHRARKTNMDGESA